MKEFELEPGEEVVLETRKHWFIFLTELIPFVIIAMIPFVIPRLIQLMPQTASYTRYFHDGGLFGRAMLGIWLLITWTSAWGTFTRYFLNAWVLTNQRIVNIKQLGYFNREVSSLFLSRVQDVTTQVTGVIPSLLGIGDIIVQSAGEEEEFSMRGIPQPERMRDRILTYASPQSKNTGV